MTTASALATEVRNILGRLSSKERVALADSKGYAYEAYVLSAVGEQLTFFGGWQWVHPNNGPTFARGNGGGLRLRITNFSHLKSTRGIDRVLVQGLSVSGVSSVTHDLDLALCRLAHSPATPFDCVDLLAAVEAKNYSGTLSVGAARNLIGLAFELDIRRIGSCGCPALHLVASGQLSSRTGKLARYWNILPLGNASPGQHSVWIDAVAVHLYHAC